MGAALTFEHVSKRYQFRADAGSLRNALAGVTSLLPGRTRKPPRVVQALEDVSFEVQEGDSFALVGLNGAGKTTAMKIATRVIYPSGGRVRVRGRVGALIEVGTGLHPELTGHENIDLYGRILGLRRADIIRHKEAIIDFAGIGEAIDQPIKQYSSGMQVRLGFSIAAHLDPEVLVVDEAMAVGDAGFQHKCIQRMAKLTREGRTLVFVSHDMTAVETLTQRAVLLNRGRVDIEGTSREVVRTYLDRIQRQIASDAGEGSATGYDFDITGVSLRDAGGRELVDAVSGDDLTVRIDYRTHRRFTRPFFSIGITDGTPQPLVLASMLIDGRTPSEIDGVGFVECTFDRLPLNARPYEIWISVRDETGYSDLLTWQRVRRFEVVNPQAPGTGSLLVGAMAPVIVPYRWSASVALQGRPPEP